MVDIPTPRIDAIASEARLLRTIRKLSQTLLIANCVSLGMFDESLAHCTPTLIRLALEELHKLFMNGELDFQKMMTADDLEMLISTAVSTAAGKLLRTAPNGGVAPQAPSREDPGEESTGC